MNKITSLIRSVGDWLYEFRFPIFVGSMLIAFIGGIAYLMHHNAVWWKAYKAAYNCKPSEQTRTQVGFTYMFGANGNITGTIPYFWTERLWTCDTMGVWRAE